MCSVSTISRKLLGVQCVMCIAINQYGSVVEAGTEEMDPQETEYISLLSVVVFIESEIVKEYFRFAKMINCVKPLTQ